MRLQFHRTILKLSTMLIACVAMTHAQQLTSFSCTPTTIIPGATSRCLVYMSAPAPAGGLVAYLSSSSSNLSVPASTNILATASIFQFYATASSKASVLETATLTVRLLSYSKSTTITINPSTAFYFHGNYLELSSLYNGASVRPTAPSNWLGTMYVRGSGYLAFDPVTSNNGISLHVGGSQNNNTAFVNFSGAEAGQIFHTQGEISFLLKSAHSFVSRQGLPQPNVRYAFAVYDDTRNQFGFYTYTSSGRLVFAYTARGITTSYMVPAGQEDTLFGAGRVVNVRIAWSSSSCTLYLNDQAVRTSSFMPLLPNWSAQSAFTIGASSIRASGGGYYSSDDAVGEVKVR